MSTIRIESTALEGGVHLAGWLRQIADDTARHSVGPVVRDLRTLAAALDEAFGDAKSCGARNRSDGTSCSLRTDHDGEHMTRRGRSAYYWR